MSNHRLWVILIADLVGLLHSATSAWRVASFFLLFFSLSLLELSLVSGWCPLISSHICLMGCWDVKPCQPHHVKHSSQRERTKSCFFGIFAQIIWKVFFLSIPHQNYWHEWDLSIFGGFSIVCENMKWPLHSITVGWLKILLGPQCFDESEKNGSVPFNPFFELLALFSLWP